MDRPILTARLSVLVVLVPARVEAAREFLAIYACVGRTALTVELRRLHETALALAESQGIARADLEKTVSLLREQGVLFQELGEVGGDTLSIRVNGETFRWQVADLYDDWWNAIRRTVEDERERIPSL